jgi:hypothetical protein
MSYFVPFLTQNGTIVSAEPALYLATLNAYHASISASMFFSFMAAIHQSILRNAFNKTIPQTTKSPRRQKRSIFMLPDITVR